MEDERITTLNPMTIEEAVSLVQQMHVITIDKSDPILIINTIFADYFIRLQNLNENHKQATVSVMEDVVNKLSENIHNEIEEYQKSVRSLALENVTALVHEHTKNMEQHKDSIKNLTIITALCSIFSFLTLLIMVAIK